MRFGRSTFAVLATCALVGASATTAVADEPPGEVVAFTHEFDQLTVWTEPTGCNALPPGAHVILNQTDHVITIYADPLCVFPIEPFARVKPGYGTHVSAVGSFRA